MQISPGKNDNLHSATAAFTVWDSGSIGLSLVLESRPSQVSLICDFCSSARNFAHRELFIPQSGFLQIPSRDGHPCLRLMLPTTKRIVDFHHQVIAHAGRTRNTARNQGEFRLYSTTFPLIPFYIILILTMIGSIVVGVKSCNDAKEEETEETQETTIVEEEIAEPETNAPEPQLADLGEFRLTAYCACEKCCGKWAINRPVDENGNTIVYTASMKVAEAGWTVAADTSVLPFGTRIWIDGHEYEVQDRGGAIKGNRIDIYFDSHEEACQFGVQYKNVYVSSTAVLSAS